MKPDLKAIEFENMKYWELQKLAKQHGVKANMKADKLITAIQDVLSANKPVQESPAKEMITDMEAPPELQDISPTFTEEPEPVSSEPELARSSVKEASKAKGRKTKRGKRQAKTSKPSPDGASVKADKPDVVNASPPPTGVKTPKLQSPFVKAVSNIRGSGSKANTPARGSKLSTPARGSKLNTPARGSKLNTPTIDNKAQRSSGIVKGKKRSCSPAVTEVAPSKRPRRSTGGKVDSVTEAGDHKTSPGMKKLIDSMDGEMEVSRQKEVLLALLDEKVKEKNKNGAAPEKSTHIPRFTGLASATTKQETGGSGSQRKTAAKDWGKIHQKEVWAKMDSLDTYVKKRTARTESLLSPAPGKDSMEQSVKKIRAMTEEMKTALASLKKNKTPKAEEKKKSGSRIVKAVKPKSGLFQSPAPAQFVPKVLSTNKMDLNFGGVASFKGAQRKSPRLSQGPKTPQNRIKPAIKTGTVTKTPRTVTISSTTVKHVVPSSVAKENKGNAAGGGRKSVVTPFKFAAESSLSTTLNTSGFPSAKKFDLKASLSRPITWKAHSGKLQPLVVQNLYTHQTDVKQVKVASRDDRRKKTNQHRAAKRQDAKMKNRGIVA